MARDYWLNLSVKDLDRARAFFTDLGLTIDADPSAPPDMAAVRIGRDQMPIMLVLEDRFRHFAGLDSVHTGGEMMITIGVESKEEVDEMAARVEPAGGRVFAPPAGDELMYGAAFTDPDGHRWNLLYMGS